MTEKKGNLYVKEKTYQASATIHQPTHTNLHHTSLTSISLGLYNRLNNKRLEIIS